MTKHELNRHVGIAQQILRALDCPRSLSISIMLDYGMWDEIANLQIDPSSYNDPETFFRAYQATKLLSKASWLPTSIDRRVVAKRKFEEAEERCRQTNEAWCHFHRTGDVSLIKGSTSKPDLERILFSARRKIGMVLGSNLFGWTELCNFGPGADGSTVHGMTSAYNKLCSPGSITRNALPYFGTFVALTRLMYHFQYDIETRNVIIPISRGNKVAFVPKNAKTDRPIAVEPRWNIWMQKGVGRFLRKRLKLFSVNLDFQGLNQALAIYSSRTGKYATLDLASASDTVSMEVVKTLLPLPWLTIFENLRSPYYSLDGEEKEYHKWSSMGNGYTFELESLLFWALCSSIDEDISIYGDDLVVPSESYETIVRVLGMFGFSVNTSKSFHHGYFRESCGTDAFNGTLVTPIYWKDPLDVQGTLTLVNQITVLATRLGSPEFRFPGLKKVWKELVYQLPKRFQQRGPVTISTVVHDCESQWSASRKWNWDGLFITVNVPIPIRFRYKDYDAAVTASFFSPSSDGYIVRDRLRWSKRTIFIPSGYRDLGTWGP
jgi:hypothetical protein